MTGDLVRRGPPGNRLAIEHLHAGGHVNQRKGHRIAISIRCRRGVGVGAAHAGRRWWR